MRHYRDRADGENHFDEAKNQWGWGGFVTRELQTSQIMARLVSLDLQLVGPVCSPGDSGYTP